MAGVRTEAKMVSAKDGVLLSTIVQTPDADGAWPVIIVRTPYSKGVMAKALGGLCSRGYAVVAQDVRGTGDSQGSFDLLKQEPEDAVDTAKWVLEQPFCDGSLGLVGISYLAPACVSIASTFKENVKACVWVSPLTGNRDSFLVNGAVRLHHNLPWMALGHPKFREADWGAMYRKLPLADAFQGSGLELPGWSYMCRSWDKWWEGRDLSGYFREVEAPGLHFAGTWDFMLDCAFEGYELLGGADRGQTLVIGPWSHNGVASEATKNAYADYGNVASSGFRSNLMAWFDHWLKGQPLPANLESPLSAFVPGRGWVHASSWPPASGRDRLFYLGEGILTESPGPDGEMGFIYDPDDPMPTRGGAVWEFPLAGFSPGPAEVNLDSSPNYLSFRSDVLNDAATCLGPASVTLYVASDAPTTDFTAAVIDEDTEGVGTIVADTIYRWEQNEGGEIALDFPVLAHTFKAGHRIRLDISSSNFPKFDRNLNTGESGLVSGKTQLANQTIHFREGNRSTLSITLI